MSLFDFLGAGLSYLGQRDANSDNKEIAERNIDLQKQFAQHGVRWKVEDSLAAGIHPLFGLGASTHSFTPVSAFQENEFALPSRHLAEAGQDISRSINATRTKDEKMKAHMDALALERGYLENDLLRSQIAKMNQAGSPPSFPGRLPERGELPYPQSEYPAIRTPAGVMAVGPDSPAQAVEDEYGDIVGMLHGATRFTKDALKNFYDYIPFAVDRALPQRGRFVEKYGYSGFDAMP